MLIQKKVKNQHEEAEPGVVGSVGNTAQKALPAPLGKALERVHPEKGTFKKSDRDGAQNDTCGCHYDTGAEFVGKIDFHGLILVSAGCLGTAAGRFYLAVCIIKTGVCIHYTRRINMVNYIFAGYQKGFPKGEPFAIL